METPARIAERSDTDPLKVQYEAGKQVAAQTGCLACHKLGENGNAGPGPELTHIADRLPAAGIAATLINPTAPMPSFKSLRDEQPEKFRDLVVFLGELKEDE